jgi:hypothetical protein
MVREVLEIKPDSQEEYYEKGLSITKSSRYNALISYNKAIKIKVDYCEAFSTKVLAIAKIDTTQRRIVIIKSLE